ncbi:MAG: hypothetical protein IIZ59_01775, partial [Clostridia bacterium]|nr:hypothetical protein [Clostridia bacterium]
AQFPMETITVTGNAAEGYKVNGYVDSQNGYGAMIRNDFHAEVTVSKAGYLTVTSSTVGTIANAQNTSNFIIRYIWITILTAIGGAILYFIDSSIFDLFY